MRAVLSIGDPRIAAATMGALAAHAEAAGRELLLSTTAHMPDERAVACLAEMASAWSGRRLERDTRRAMLDAVEAAHRLNELRPSQLADLQQARTTERRDQNAADAEAVMAAAAILDAVESPAASNTLVRTALVIAQSSPGKVDDLVGHVVTGGEPELRLVNPAVPTGMTWQSE